MSDKVNNYGKVVIASDPKRPKKGSDYHKSYNERNPAGKYWAFTVNGVDPEFDLAQTNVATIMEKHGISYMAGQVETGENGNVHWQGYCETMSAMRFKALKDTLVLIFGIQPHLKQAFNRVAARNYCLKDDTRTGTRAEVKLCYACAHVRSVIHVNLDSDSDSDFDLPLDE